MGPSTTTARATLPPPSPIQRAYLVGDQDGMELRGPARYYLACDLDVRAADGVPARFAAALVRDAVLRSAAGPDAAVVVHPVDVEPPCEVLTVPDDERAATDRAVRDRLCADPLAADRPQVRVVVVRGASGATLHVAYALRMMDAASLEVFLTALVADVDDAVPDAAPGPALRDRSARDLEFWRTTAARLPDAPELPLRPGWRTAGPRTRHVTVELPVAVAADLARACADRGLSVPSALLAAYGSTLARWSGSVPVTLTVLRTRRTGPARPGPLGNEGTTMPVAVPAPTSGPFTEVARQVQRTCLVQALHGSLDGAAVARLRDGAPAQGSPFPYAFTAFEVDTTAEAHRGLRRRWHDVELRVPQVLLDHQVVLDQDGGVLLCFDWRADAFDDGAVEDLVAQHRDLLLDLAARPDAWDAPPVRAGLVTTAPPPRPVADTLHARVLASAARTPDAPALVTDGGVVTYAELVRRATVVADRLRGAGARPGDPVVVQLPRGAGQVVGVLGCLLAGCVFVPVDVTTPAARADAVARRAAVRVVVATGRDARRWADAGHVVVAPDVPAGVTADVPPAVAPSGTAYVIFTSGSTGEPKGVVVAHAAALATIDAVDDELDLRPQDRVLAVSSLGFDLSVWDVFGPLLRGGAVVLLTEDTAREPAAWAHAVRTHGVTVWNSAPALASLLAEEGTALPSVRAYLLSGDWIPVTLPGALQRLAPGADVLSLGGATEGAIWSILHRVQPADAHGRSVPYGRPLRGQDVVVLDHALRPCRDWEIGELYLCGAGVADGYLHDPERTAAAFGQHPDLGWVYRTGDRGRRHPSGVLEFLGRADTQVKVHGHRVELGEIEHTLGADPAVRGCAAFVRGTGAGARLVAAVTLETGAGTDTDVAAWRARAREALVARLPRYMVPDTLLVLDELPLSPSGKVDRRALARLAPDVVPSDATGARATGSHAAGAETAPSDAAPEPGAPVDTRPPAADVAACWQEVLGRPPSGRTFFEDGGSSYDAIRLLSALRTRHGLRVPFGTFVAAPTLADLVRACRTPQAAAPGGVRATVVRRPAHPRLRVVLLPPVGGGTGCYTDLVDALAPDVEVVTVAVDEAHAATVPGIAHACAAVLPPVADGVPVVLAGWSFGGVLAWELARWCDPVRVVVVDSPASGGPAPGGGTADFLLDVRRSGGPALAADAVRDDPLLQDRYAVYRQNLAALAAWRPDPADVAVVHLVAADSDGPRGADAWRGLGRVTVSTVLDGGHYDVLATTNLPRVVAAIERGA